MTSDPLALIDRVQTLNSALREAMEAIEVLADPEKFDAMPSDETRAQYAKRQIAAAKAALRG